MTSRARKAGTTVVVVTFFVAITTAGFLGLRGGLEERSNAKVLAAPDNVMVPATATVTSGTANTKYTEIPVRFTTAEGDRVKTWVWFLRRGISFDAGDKVDIEYVSGHPTAARLVGPLAGEARYGRTILTGAVFFLSGLLPLGGLVWGLLARRWRRRRAPA